MKNTTTGPDHSWAADALSCSAARATALQDAGHWSMSDVVQREIRSLCALADLAIRD